MALNHHIRARFAKDTLRGIPNCTPTILNIRKTRRRITGLLAWMRAESGNGGNTGSLNDGPANNPHCSTWPYHYPAYNAIGVRDFTDFDTGVAETLNTLFLSGHNYEPIIEAIQAGRELAIVQAVDRSDWGTHGAEDALPYTLAHYKQESYRPVGVPS